MTKYRNMFLDKEQNKIVSVDLDVKEVAIGGEENTQSLAEEYDIKGGYKDGYAHKSSPYLEASLTFDMSLGRGSDLEDRIVNRMSRDSRLSDGHRRAREALQVMFNNYVLSSYQGRGDYRYTLSSGAVPDFEYNSNGIELHHFLLERDGNRMDDLNSYDVVPNIYSSGSSCHGSMHTARSWANRKGLELNHPKSLLNTYELFVSGKGNHDLTGCNNTIHIRNEEMVEIIQEFQREYVDNLDRERIKRTFTMFNDTFIDGLQEGVRSNDSSLYDVPYLAAIIDKTKSFYIEDYL